MTKTALVILTAAPLLVATPVLAKGNADVHVGVGSSVFVEQRALHLVKQEVATVSATPVASCDPNADWNNHGAYVSCVARLHEGGVSVSAAAKSDIGKKIATDSAHKRATDSGEVTVTPVASGSAHFKFGPMQPVATEIQALINELQNLIHSLQNLIK